AARNRMFVTPRDWIARTTRNGSGTTVPRGAGAGQRAGRENRGHTPASPGRATRLRPRPARASGDRHGLAVVPAAEQLVRLVVDALGEEVDAPVPEQEVRPARVPGLEPPRDVPVCPRLVRFGTPLRTVGTVVD